MKLVDSAHLTFTEITSGLVAALQREGGWAIGNAGIIDLGDKTLVFDTTMTPAAADDLRLAARRMTGRTANYVINSHYHNDHIWGNQVFPVSTQIISTAKTRDLILTEGQNEYKWFKQNSSKRLEELRRQFKNTSDPTEAANLTMGLTYYQALVKSMPGISVRIPDVTFEERLVIHGRDRTAEMISLGRGHTKDDAILFLPEDSTIFMADLLFIDHHPYLPDGDPENWLRLLDQVVEMRPQRLVPGHGPVGSLADLQVMREYIEQIMQVAHQMADQGVPDHVIAEEPVPESCRNWGLSEFYSANLSFLVEMYKEANNYGGTQ